MALGSIRMNPGSTLVSFGRHQGQCSHPSLLMWPISVGAVLNSHNCHDLKLIVDSVDDPVIAAPGAMQSGEAELEWLANPAGIRGQ